MSAMTDECAGLTRNMTWEEQKELLTRALDAVERGDKALGDSLVKQLPVLPGLARLAFEWYGREHCETHFNLSAANKEFGEGWMDA